MSLNVVHTVCFSLYSIILQTTVHSYTATQKTVDGPSRKVQVYMYMYIHSLYPHTVYDTSSHSFPPSPFISLPLPLPSSPSHSLPLPPSLSLPPSLPPSSLPPFLIRNGVMDVEHVRISSQPLVEQPSQWAKSSLH